MKKVKFKGKCPICLVEPIEDPSLIIPCYHEFCLGCISQWIERVCSCPLCVKKINSLVYDIKSEDDFKSISFDQGNQSNSSTHSSDGKCQSLNTPVHPFRQYIYFRKKKIVPYVTGNIRFTKDYFLKYKTRILPKMRIFVRRELETILRSFKISYISEFVLSHLENFNLENPEERNRFNDSLATYVVDPMTRAIFVNEVVNYGRCCSTSSIHRFDELELKRMKSDLEEHKKVKMIDED